MKEWSNLKIEEVIQKLETDSEKGLSDKEVKERQKIYGKNSLPEKPPATFLKLFINQFKEFLTIILISATIVSLFLGEVKDAIAIFIIVLINAILGATQEFKAEKTLASLKALTNPVVKVIREGEIEEIPIENLVPGDIILLEEGEKIPADVRFIETNYLQVDESILTGESEAVRKDANFIGNGKLDLGEQYNMGFKGTYIISGKGKGVVVGIGEHTALGKIAKMLSEMKEEPTPLQRELEKLGKQISILILILVLMLLGIGIIQRREFIEMFMTSVSLAVAAIPEGLPTVITILLALGVQEMARRKAVVRRLSAVEALGATTVICTDKTGTLTENRMELVKIGLPEKVYERDDFSKFMSEIYEILESAILCSNVRKKEEVYLGDPLEIALIRSGESLGIVDKIMNNKEKVKEIPFDSQRKRVSVIYKNKDGYLLFMKGAPEGIIKKSKYVKIYNKDVELNEEIEKRLTERQIELAKEGLRVLGVAKRNMKDLNQENLEEDLTFLGFIAFLDPLRDGVKEAVDLCSNAGIRPIIVTGDYIWTAKKIAKDLGMDIENGVSYQGEDLSDEKAFDSINWDKVSLFSRVLPEHKMEIVKKLKEKGEVVAMTGDGVNDAPALKMADIGVSMGQRGTEVAREASDLILLDDSFATIVKAVEEGRRIFDNIRKVTYYLFSCNLSEIIVVGLSILLRFPLPLTPIELLWINLITDGFPALALGIEPAEKDVMERKPRSINEGILTKEIWKKLLLDGTIMGIASLSLFYWGLTFNNITLARTLAFSGLVFTQLFQALSLSLRRRKDLIKDTFSNIHLILAITLSFSLQLLILYTTFGRNFFNLEYLNFERILIVIFVSLLPIYKLILEKIYEKIF
ncbi:MAG: calcium-translocating P-type ATPase, PMCA-type [Dictyoglomaceae bacterium]|nr:calcium-translocating P-type ATPase, PMCA-type [Dictyoglomaceae bacterium]